MAFLSPEGAKRISRLVEEAEAESGGEISVAIIPESDEYAFRELLFALVSGILTYVLLAVFINPLGRLVDSLFWNVSALTLPLLMLTLSFIVGAIFYFLFQIPALDRLIVGRKRMAEAVRRRALRQFVEAETFNTVDRTGILLFISNLERRVELLADKGINSLVASETWNEIVANLVNGMRRKQTEAALATAITAIGKVISTHVPRRPDDKNELPNKPTELEKGS